MAVGDFLDRLKQGFKDRYSEGSEDYRQAYYDARELQGKDKEDVRIKSTFATNPTVVTARDLIGDAFPNAPDWLKSDKIYRQAREERGMGLSSDVATRVGQVLGTIGNDLTQDTSRRVWWLLNAPQATGSVINEYVLGTANSDLYKHDTTKVGVPVMETDSKGRRTPKVYENQGYTDINYKKYQQALAQDLISKEGTKRKGVGQKDGVFTRRRFNPGDVAALGIPSGIAINAGIGLLNPFGGSERYLQ